jgi:hypothetical protein
VRESTLDDVFFALTGHGAEDDEGATADDRPKKAAKAKDRDKAEAEDRREKEQQQS